MGCMCVGNLILKLWRGGDDEVIGSLWICRRVDMIQGDEECWEKSWVTNDQS